MTIQQKSIHLWYTNTTYINTKSSKSTDHYITTKTSFFFTTCGPLFFSLKVLFRISVYYNEESQCFLKITEQFYHFHAVTLLQLQHCPDAWMCCPDPNHKSEKAGRCALVISVLIVEWLAGVVGRKTHLSEDRARNEELGLNRSRDFTPARGFPAADTADAVHAGTECLRGFSSDGLLTQYPSS